MAKSVFDAVQQLGKALEGLSAEDQQKALDGAAVLLGLAKTPGGPGLGSASGRESHSGGANSGREGGKQKSVVEYLNDKHPASNPQRIAVFAAYREEIEGVEHFSKDDMEKYFTKAKLAPPGKNFNRDYNSAAAEGWIHDDGANSYLTQTGQGAVAVGFGGKGRPRGQAAAKTSGKKGKSKG